MANEDSAFYQMGVMLGQAVNSKALNKFEQDRPGSVERTLHGKAAEIVSVMDFGAKNDGSEDAAAAFAAAASAASFIAVPPGTYLLSTDVNAENTVFEMQDASLVGGGTLRARHVISKDARGVYTSKQRGYVDAHGASRSFADLATVNPGEYPKKYFPTSAFVELLRLSPGVTKFETSDGTTTNIMTEQFYREMLGEMAANGIQSVVLPYVEYQGLWFYKPGFAYPYDYDTSRDGDFWWDWISGTWPNVENFDPVRVTLEECAQLGMHVYLGLGRNGDSALLNDLYDVNIGGQPDPIRYGLTLALRLSNACNRTREVAADLIDQFGHYPSFGGFYISHEPDHLGSANNYLSNVTLVSGDHPMLRSYNKPIMVAPSSPIDLSVSGGFPTAVINSGCDIFLPQDSVGPGADLDTGDYTYDPDTTIPQLADHFALWQNVMRIVNAKQALTNRSVRLWITTETWQMDGPNYDNDYPADFSRVHSQLLEEWPFIESVCLYSWFGMMDSGSASLRLMQTNSGKSDYRTRASALYSAYSSWAKGQRDKYANASSVQTIQQQIFSRGSAAAGTSLEDDFATFHPRSEGSRVTYLCIIRGTLALGTGTLTVRLRVGGVVVKTAQDVVISGTAGGTYVLLYSELPKGMSRNIGISFLSSEPDFTLSGVDILVTETV